MQAVPFNKPFTIDKEFEYIQDTIENSIIRGDGIYTQKCHNFLESYLPAKRCLLTHSCTAALEMAAILADIKQGDEVMMPSYTFVSTANAFVLRGGVPVFVDIKPDTKNINEELIESAITEKTKAIVPVHYAGVACDMDKIMRIASKHNLIVIEDAAQGVSSTYNGQKLGTIGDIGCFSFHETKNVISGEGGAIIINNDKFIQRAEIIREKGTNRSQFFRGEVDKYTWVDVGSSYLPSDIIAAFLYAQLQNIDKINSKRLEIWNEYHQFFAHYEKEGLISRPIVPPNCTHNAHMYYITFKNLQKRSEFIAFLKENGINPVFHYIPLHSSPAGIKFAKTMGDMPITNQVADTLVRMPLFYGLCDEDMKRIKSVVERFFEKF